MADLRHRQLPGAIAARPDVAVILADMNDTLWSDFDPVALRKDLDVAVAALQATGAVVLTIRYHDHGQVFWLPGPLRRVLYHRVEQLNDAIDQVVAQRGALCLDLHRTPGAYDSAAWSVDRLHPSELGHRLLACGFADLLTGAGIAVPYPVDLACGGGRQLTAAHHIGWLVCRGTPWLVRRGRDLLPHVAVVVAQDLFGWLRQQLVSYGHQEFAHQEFAHQKFAETSPAQHGVFAATESRLATVLACESQS